VVWGAAYTEGLKDMNLVIAQMFAAAFWMLLAVVLPENVAALGWVLSLLVIVALWAWGLTKFGRDDFGI
jgi:hypothetical protein